MSAPTDSEIMEVSGPGLTAAQVHDILRLRVDVFVVEQECPYPEIDGADLSPSTQHVWIEDETGVAAYIRLLGSASTTGRTNLCASGASPLAPTVAVSSCLVA